MGRGYKESPRFKSKSECHGTNLVYYMRQVFVETRQKCTKNKGELIRVHAGSKMERPRIWFVGTQSRRSKLWWPGSDAGSKGVGILVKQKITANVVEVGRKSD